MIQAEVFQGGPYADSVKQEHETAPRDWSPRCRDVSRNGTDTLHGTGTGTGTHLHVRYGNHMMTITSPIIVSLICQFHLLLGALVFVFLVTRRLCTRKIF